jgi:hypothetical protein
MRADERTRTADLISLRVIIHAFEARDEPDGVHGCLPHPFR